MGNSLDKDHDHYTKVLCCLRIWASLIKRGERCRSIQLSKITKRSKRRVVLKRIPDELGRSYYLREKMLWQYYKLFTDRCVFLNPQRLEKLQPLVSILRMEILRWRQMPVMIVPTSTSIED